MANDLKDRRPRDRARIDVNETRKVPYWCKKFGCTERQLRDAVAKVGVMADDVGRAVAVSRRLDLFAGSWHRSPVAGQLRV